MNNNKSSLKALDFAIVETALYLNTHPDDTKALGYYNKLIGERRDLLEAYHKNCGPLTIFDGESKTTWDWAKTPWPWEMED